MTDKIQRHLECKILQLNTQLEHQKQQKQQLMQQYERIKKLLIDANHEIQQHKKQCQIKTNLSNKLKKQKAQLQDLLKSSQSHRKTLYDHMFVEQNKNYQSSSVLKNQNKMMEKIYEINELCSNRSYNQMTQILEQRNVQILKISQKYNQLMKKHFKCTSQYQEIIGNLKSQIFKIKKSEEIRSNIEKQINSIGQHEDYEVLKITNKTLQQRLDMLVQKIRLDQEYTGKVKVQLEDKNFRVSQLQKQLQRQLKINPKTLEVEKYIQILQQNSKIKQKYQQLSKKYDLLTIQYPNVVKNQDSIRVLMDKQKYILKIQSERNLKDIAVQSLNKRLLRIEEQCRNQKKRAEESISKLQGVQKYYEVIFSKFKEFIAMINPHYEVYFWNQLQLDQKQLELIKTGKAPSQQTNLRLEKSNLQKALNKFKSQLQIKSSENMKLYQQVEGLVKKVTQMQTINLTLTQTIFEKDKAYSSENRNESEKKYIQYLLQSITKLQQERNKVQLQLKDKQVKIIELMVQNKYLKDRQMQQTPQDNKLFQLTDLEFCRPSIVWVQISKDITDITHNLKQFQTQIRRINQQYQFNIKQVKAEYQSRIIKLNQKILRLESQRTQVTELNARQVSQDLGTQQQHHQQPPINQTNTILDMQYAMIGEDRESIDQPLSNLNKQSIQQMNKLLKNNQSNMKNLILSYTQLNQRFIQLQKKQEERKIREGQERQNFNKELKKYIQQISISKSRIIESDKNMIGLQQKLAQKESQIQRIKRKYQLQNQSLNKLVSNLKEQIQKLKKYDQINESIKKVTQKTQKDVMTLPEQTQYLIEIMLQKQKELKKNQTNNKYKNQNKNLGQLLPQNQINSQTYTQKQKQQLQSLIKDGKIYTLLDITLNKIDQYKNKIAQLQQKLVQRQKEGQGQQGQQDEVQDDDNM